MNIYRYEFEYKVYNNDGLEVDKGIETSKGYDEVRAENYLRTRLEEGCQSDEEVEIKLIPKLVKYVDANKIIAEFMGIESDNAKMRGHLYECPVTAEYVTELEYHTSWDWLMPVVEKIYQLGLDNEGTLLVRDAVAEANSDDTYQAVVEFIKEYNQNT